MKWIYFFFRPDGRFISLKSWLVMSVLMSLCGVMLAADSPRERLSLDFDWKFHLGNDWGLGEKLDKAGESSGPAKMSFNDTSWRLVNLPHDWVAELPFDASADNSHGSKPDVHAASDGFEQTSVAGI